MCIHRCCIAFINVIPLGQELVLDETEKWLSKTRGTIWRGMSNNDGQPLA